MPNLVEQALTYRAAGLCPLPASLSLKYPTITKWKPFQTALPSEQQINMWFEDAEAICILCGDASERVECIDFDSRAEKYAAWKELVDSQLPGLVDRLYRERTQHGGLHVVYRTAESSAKCAKLAMRIVEAPDENLFEIDGKKYKPVKRGEKHYALVTLIETKCQGGLIVCAPTPGYVAENCHLLNLPTISAGERELLIEAARSLNEDIAPVKTPVLPNTQDAGHRPGDEFNQRGDIRPILVRHGWTLMKPGENEYWRRPGKTEGWSATLKGGVFYVFTSNAAPFEMSTAYGPFHAYTLLEHGGDFAKAAGALRMEGFGDDVVSTPAVDISALLPAEPGETSMPVLSDPGPVPEELLRIPGFVGEVMDYSLLTAPYPNPVMAFAGALALQAFLAGRKVCDPGDNRTNLYLLGLAHSAAGKDWPRKVNTRIIHTIGLSAGLGDRFASGEGIQDALFANPCMLFQTDEIDGLLQSINKSKDARHENIMGTLLTMYSSANSVFPMRVKAGTEPVGVIDQPCLVIFGTAIPNHYYEALSERMLTNGFFARMIILENARRGKGQEPTRLALPSRILETAQWWHDFKPGGGNLAETHPVPAIVEHADDAKSLLIETRTLAEAEYAKAEEGSDPVGTTVWGRVNEQVRKLTLLYAISADAQSPRIDKSAADWASRFVLQQTRRMLFMAQTHVSDNDFHAKCKKLLAVLREWRAARGRQWMEFWRISRKLPWTDREHDEVRTALLSQAAIEFAVANQQGRPGRLYRLL